ncbi:MAG: PspC domain-containing protein [Chloroflexota bacterium]
MYRSFTDRVFGGVCGGIAAPLRLNAWVVRLVFIALTVGTLGAGLALYLMLWLALPQASPARNPQRGFLWGVLVVVLFAVVLGGWAARLAGITAINTGADLYYPALAVLLGVIFMLTQLRRQV